MYTWPDVATATTCVPIQADVFNLTQPVAILTVSMATAILVIAIVVMGILIKHRKTQIVKATSFAHSLTMLMAVGIAGVDIIMSCTSSVTIISCMARYGLFHLSICLIFAPLLIKNIRVYRIFAAGNRGLARPKFISGKVQMIFLSLIVLGQVILISI